MKKTIFTREELYELVWSQPISKIAKELNVSEEGIKQTCIKLNIPRPKSGYWSQIKFGKKVITPELPQKEDCAPVSILEIENNYQRIDSRQRRLSVIQKQIEKECTKYLKINRKLTNPEPEIKDYISFSKQQNSSYEIRADNSKTKLLDINVTQQQLTRALLVFDTLIKVLKERGHHLIFKYNETFAVLFEQEIKLYLREKTKRVATGENYPMYNFINTGLFTLQVDRWGGKREYTEGKKNIIEMIPRIVALMEVRADEDRQWYIESEKREKIRKLKELEHLQLEQKKEKELADSKNLLLSSNRWHKAENLRKVIDKMEESFVGNSLDEWLQWARKKADWYDPFIEVKDELMEEVDRENLTRKRIPFMN